MFLFKTLDFSSSYLNTSSTIIIGIQANCFTNSPEIASLENAV